MNSTALAAMIARRTPWEVTANLPAADVAALVTCVNRAFQLYNEKANASHVAIQQSRKLYGMQTFSITVTQYSATVTINNAPGWLSQALGSTIRIEGDPAYNRLLDASTLMMPYTGPSGTYTATLNHDAAPIGSDTVAVCTQVHYHETAGQVRQLVRDQVPKSWHGWAGAIGYPTHYDVEPCSPGANSTPFFVVRVWPIPTLPASLTFALARHYSLKIEDLQTPTAMPFPDDIVSGIIYPIALNFAASEGLLKEKTDTRLTREDAAAALANIAVRTKPPLTDAPFFTTSHGY